ncbi:phosphate ABC transporter permease subunit PstC [Halomicrobium urmianum]|uniref:phosphate ABC transporter permease subunit PstC n=1 Tax=Halomicrobium urmianum TaxID=1586233 RepID=UPI001CD9E18E|nr:phosphate ABC transporter permease subunit PstC [Halomicrobium urmianum]
MTTTASIEEIDPEELAVGAIGTILLVAAFGAFLTVPSMTKWFLLAFAVASLVGLYARQATTVKFLMLVATVSTVVILGLITVYLVWTAIPVVVHMGPDIFLQWSEPFWDTGAGYYSLFPMMWGTFVTTIIATLIAAPLGVAGAVFISELAPGSVREVVKPGVEMLAGIPSIVYGYIGYTVLNPYMINELNVPKFGSLFITGLVIGIMALPTVVSVAEDAIASVPSPMKDGALALGATDWQTTTSVTLPAAFSGISAAVLLGIGRAVGETMAATVILGNVVQLPQPLIDVFGNTITLTSLIASQYGPATGDEYHMSALFAAGVVLFVTVMAMSLTSQYIERRMRQRLGGAT